MKTAVVTGGAGFIGSAVAARLAAEGCAVAVCDLHADAARQVAARITAAGGTARGYALDVTDSAAVDALFERIGAELGTVHIAVHVAGGSARIAGPRARYCHLTEQEDEVIDRVLKVNLYGALYVSRAAARCMTAAGDGGRIINFSSTVGINGLATCVEYAAAKGGVIAMTKALSKELGEQNITVNSVAPGIVMRPGETDEHRTYDTNFLHRKCTAEDVAALVAFLASDEARFITGQVYVIDGGRSLAMKGTD